MRNPIAGSLGYLSLLAAGMPATAIAADEQPVELEAVVVTGTRIARAIEDTPNPVTTYDAVNIEQSGLTNLTDLLIQAPPLVASETKTDNSGSESAIGTAGLNLLNLRNLGVSRTLVLVNSRRHVASLPGNAAVDINTIPMDLIERVDVLTGGVSAIYGADGVSGVVNFVTKRDFEGLTIRAQSGISGQGDTGNDFISITGGRNFADGAGNVALSFEYNKDDGVSGFARPRTGDPLRTFGIVRNPDDFPDDPGVFDRIPLNDLRYAGSSRNGAIDVDWDFGADFTGDGLPYDNGLDLPESGGLAQGGSSTPLAGYQGDLQAETDRYSLNLLSGYDLSDSMRFFVEGKYVQARAWNTSQPNYDFFAYVNAANPFIPDVIRDAIVPGAAGEYGFDEDGVMFTRDNFDYGVRGDRVKRETLRGVVGLEGRLLDEMKYEFSYSYGQTKVHNVDTNSRIEERFFAALDGVDEGEFLTGTPNGNAVCRIDLQPAGTAINPENIYWENFTPGGDGSGVPITFTPGAGSGCVPVNVFGENVSDPRALAFFNASPVTRSKILQHVVSGAVTGDMGKLFELPGGTVGWAVGAEYRKEKSDSTPDDLIQESLLWGYPMIAPETGSFDVKEAFAEISVPVLSGAPFAHLLSFGGAIRFSDYSTIGSTSTWKVDTTWAPIRDVMFRGTYSEAVRAPNIAELFSPTSGTFQFIDDPCDPVNVPEGTAFRAANCVALLTGLGIDPDAFSPTTDPEATTSLPGRSGGNPLLQEEKAKSWTAGFVLRPRFAPGLSLSFDWYNIKLQNAISTAEAQDIVDLCVDQPTLENGFCESVGRDPDTGYVDDFLVGPQNVASYKTAGADMMLAYNFAPWPEYGRFNLRLSGGYLDKLTLIATPGAETDNDRKDTFAPKYTATTDLTWAMGPVSLNYGVNYFSRTRRYSEAQKEANPDISDRRYFYYKSKWVHDLRGAYALSDKGVQLYAGVNNLFNKLPAFASLNYPTGFVGRYFYAGARFDMQ